MKIIFNTLLAFLFMASPIASLNAMESIQTGRRVTSYYDLLPKDLQKELEKFTPDLMSAATYFWLLKDQERRNPHHCPFLKIKNAIKAQFINNDDKFTSIQNKTNVKIYDAKTGTCLKSLMSPDPIDEVQVSKNNDKFLTKYQSSRSDIRIWDISTARCLQKIELPDICFDAQFNNTSDKIVVALRNSQSAQVYDIASGECLQALRHNNWVHSAEFDKTGDKIVTGSTDCTARIWDAKTGKCLKILNHKQVHSSGSRSSEVWYAKFNKTGDKIVTTAAGFAYIWDVSSGQCLQKIQSSKNLLIASAKFNQNGNAIITLETHSDIRGPCIASLYDARTGVCLGTIGDGPYTIYDVDENFSKVITKTCLACINRGFDRLHKFILDTCLPLSDKEINVQRIINEDLKNELEETLTPAQANILEEAYQCAQNKQPLVLSTEHACKAFDDLPVKYIISDTIKVERCDAQKKIQKFINVGLFAAAGYLAYLNSK